MDTDWTEATDAEANELFATLSTAEIRRRQALADAQIKIAHDQGNTRALSNLQRMQDALMRAMLDKVPPKEGDAQ